MKHKGLKAIPKSLFQFKRVNLHPYHVNKTLNSQMETNNKKKLASCIKLINLMITVTIEEVLVTKKLQI